MELLKVFLENVKHCILSMFSNDLRSIGSKSIENKVSIMLAMFKDSGQVFGDETSAKITDSSVLNE